MTQCNQSIRLNTAAIYFLRVYLLEKLYSHSFQVDCVQDRSPVRHIRLSMDYRPVPDKPFLPGRLHCPQLPAGHLTLHRPLFSE